MTPGADVDAPAWSLASRLTGWMVLCGLLPGAVALVTGYVFLRSSVIRELRALAAEEVDESLVRLRHGVDPRTGFESIAVELADDHPDTPFAWRLFDVATGRTLHEYGPSNLQTLELPATFRTPGISLGRSEHLGDGYVVTAFAAAPHTHVRLLIDGRSRYALIESYRLTAGVMLIVGAVVALGVSCVGARRVSGLVRGIADGVREAHAAGQELTIAATVPAEIRSVTEALREEMRMIRAEAEKVRVFTAGLAHELRSPLQNLIGQAEVALLGRRDPESYAAVLMAQLRELGEFGDAVDNLLAICTTRRAAEDQAAEYFDLAAEAELRLSRERSRAVREGLNFAIESAGDTQMSGDREAVLRGVRNVVANALDWAPPAGRVSVSIRGESDMIHVVVDDNGPGVPLAERPRIFDPFVRGRIREGRRIGYGLGLAIARSAVEAHGGTISVTESPLGGARFMMTLRRSQRAASS